MEPTEENLCKYCNVTVGHDEYNESGVVFMCLLAQVVVQNNLMFIANEFLIVLYL